MSLSVRVACTAALGAALAIGGLAARVSAQGPAQPPAFTAEQAKRGAEFYNGSCAECHGQGLDDGQFAPPLKGAAHKTYWAGKTAEDLLVYMSTNMPPTQPGGLGPQAYADIMAYMLQADGAAPGAAPLPADPAAVRTAAPTR
jgi:mono/diheme cytochrome c family protein